MGISKKTKKLDTLQRWIMLGSCAVFVLGAILMLVYAFGTASPVLFWLGIIFAFAASGGLIYSNIIFAKVVDKKRKSKEREEKKKEKEDGK